MKRLCCLWLVLTILLLSASASGAPAIRYTITVDYVNQITTVYDAVTGDMVRQMICSGGAPGFELETGEYVLTDRERDSDRTEWVYILDFRCYVQYVTRITGGYLFHSVPFWAKKHTSLDAYAWFLLGQPASHGCIRLLPEDAQWIAENCPAGTKVTISATEEANPALRESLLPGMPPDEYGVFSEDEPEKYTRIGVVQPGGAKLIREREVNGEQPTVSLSEGTRVYVLKTNKYYYKVQYRYLTGLIARDELKTRSRE